MNYQEALGNYWCWDSKSASCRRLGSAWLSEQLHGGPPGGPPAKSSSHVGGRCQSKETTSKDGNYWVKWQTLNAAATFKGRCHVWAGVPAENWSLKKVWLLNVKHHNVDMVKVTLTLTLQHWNASRNCLLRFLQHSLVRFPVPDEARRTLGVIRWRRAVKELRARRWFVNRTWN